MTGPLVGTSNTAGISGVLGENTVGGSITPSPVSAGVLGVSAEGPGVKGVSQADIGVVEGIQLSSRVSGTTGERQTGGNGTTAVGNGVRPGPGVLGVSSAGPGVAGASDSGIGVV